MGTTRELSKELNELIEKNNDAYRGYKKAADHADNSQLSSYLMQQASERRNFAHKLTTSLKAYDPDYDVDTDGSTTGSIHRSWMDVKAALSVDDDESILEECIRGDKSSVEEYEEFLNDHPVAPSEIKSAVQDQLQNIRDTLAKVKTMEDIR